MFSTWGDVAHAGTSPPAGGWTAREPETEMCPFLLRPESRRIHSKGIAMFFAYVTTDGILAQLAVKLAEECGVTLCPQSPEDGPVSANSCAALLDAESGGLAGPSNGRFNALLFDWDSLSPEQRQRIPPGTNSDLIAVHGHDLDCRVADTLREHGVVVFRYLDLPLFRTLCHMARLKAPISRRVCHLLSRSVAPAVAATAPQLRPFVLRPSRERMKAAVPLMRNAHRMPRIL